jgi:hypothetical protein
MVGLALSRAIEDEKKIVVVAQKMLSFLVMRLAQI